MNGWTLLGCALVFSTHLFSTRLAAAAPAQTADRIWGRVHATDGDVHAGFIRWDRDKASWADILEGLKELPGENYLAWLEAHDRERATRTIELRGHRVTWNEIDPDFPMEVLSGVRFGHLDSLVMLDPGRAELTLRSGRRLRLKPRGEGRRNAPRAILVDVPGGTEVELEMAELERVVFSAPPPDALPAARRLYGTAEDRNGNQFTGHLAWDQDEILESDVLDGRDARRPGDRRIRFERIRSLTRINRGVRVELADGAALELEGTNDVDQGNRGVRVADPGIGVVVVPWEHLRAVRLHAAGQAEKVGGTGEERGATPGARGGFDGGRPLDGVVVTREGREIRGALRWDADEAGSWEILNGEAGGIEYQIEFGFVRRIAPARDGASVTLADGRALELGGSRDTGPDNKGVMVAPRQDASARPAASEARGGFAGAGVEWTLIPRSEIQEVRFRLDPIEPAPSQPPRARSSSSRSPTSWTPSPPEHR